MLMGLSMVLTWSYLAKHEQLVAEPARAAIPAGARRALVGALAYAPAIALAFVVPAISLAVDAVIAIYFAVSRTEVPGLIFRSGLNEEP